MRVPIYLLETWVVVLGLAQTPSSYPYQTSSRGDVDNTSTNVNNGHEQYQENSHTSTNVNNGNAQYQESSHTSTNVNNGHEQYQESNNTSTNLKNGNEQSHDIYSTNLTISSSSNRDNANTNNEMNNTRAMRNSNNNGINKNNEYNNTSLNIIISTKDNDDSNTNGNTIHSSANKRNDIPNTTTNSNFINHDTDKCTENKNITTKSNISKRDTNNTYTSSKVNNKKTNKYNENDNTTRKSRTSKRETTPRKIYYLRKNLLLALPKVCPDNDDNDIWTSRDMDFKIKRRTKRTLYFPVRSCRQELNPCVAANVLRGKVLVRVKKKRSKKRIKLMVSNYVFHVILEEDEECICVADSAKDHHPLPNDPGHIQVVSVNISTAPGTVPGTVRGTVRSLTCNNTPTLIT